MLRAAAGPSSSSRVLGSSSCAVSPRLALASLGLGSASRLCVARPCLALQSRYGLAAGPSTSRLLSSASSSTTQPEASSPPATAPLAGAKLGPSPIPDPSPPTSPPTFSSSSSSSNGSSGKVRRALSAALWLPVIYFVMQHVAGLGQFHGESMSPTINPPNADGSPSRTSDVVLLDRWVGSTYAFRVGDIVTLRSPSDPDQLLTKRILAMEGDTVMVRLPLETTHAFPGASNSPKASPRSSSSSLGPNAPPGVIGDEGAVATLRLRVPPGHVWVEGDASVAEEATWEAQRALARTAASRGLPTALSLPSHGPAGRTRSRDSREFGPVPIGLLEARVSFVLWPLSRFGRPGARPGFDAEAMRERRERRESRIKRYIGSGQAHPGDSSISPYLDWDDGSDDIDGGAQDGAALPPSLSFSTTGEQQGGGSGGAKEEWEKLEELWRSHLNTLSRGGRLGDHAGRDEV